MSAQSGDVFFCCVPISDKTVIDGNIQGSFSAFQLCFVYVDGFNQFCGYDAVNLLHYQL